MTPATSELSPPKVRWDLSELFSGIEDPKIAQTWEMANREAESFAADYRGKLKNPEIDASYLRDAIRRLENLSLSTDKASVYADLLFAVEANNPEIGAFLQKQMERASEVRVKLMFAELELQAHPETTVKRLLADPVLAEYRHFLGVLYEQGKHNLTEAEEVILEETANTGGRAWVRLFDEVTANHEYHFLAPGASEPETKTEQEILDLLRNPIREVRQAAADTFTAGLKEQERVLVYLYNNLMQEKKVKDRLRKHPYAEHSRHMANELDRETVDLVVGLCKDRQDLVARFYHRKRPLLGLEQLTHIDRYAPLFEAKEQIEYERARKIVITSFRKFSNILADRADEFFEKSWIDAEPRAGKTGGAFCSYITPDTHPVVMMSYLNKMEDVMTLAHELGHGAHASLSRKQSYVNFHGTLPLAELASIFGEMLVFESLVSEASEKDQLALYASKIEGIFASVFRQAAMFRFEQRAHNARRETGELAPEQFGDIWQEELQSMFGDSLILGEQHRMWWSYVGHFIFAPFYVYAYAFGELLTLSLYEKAKREGPAFADKYIALLELGGSQTPQELMATVGVDLNDREFWLGGFAAIERMITRFEELAVAHQSS